MAILQKSLCRKTIRTEVSGKIRKAMDRSGRKENKHKAGPTNQWRRRMNKKETDNQDDLSRKQTADFHRMKEGDDDDDYDDDTVDINLVTRKQR